MGVLLSASSEVCSTKGTVARILMSRGEILTRPSRDSGHVDVL